MKDIIGDILQAENAVEQGLQEARTKAGRIKAESDREADAIISEARRKAQKLVQDAVEKARREAGNKRKAALKKAEEEAVGKAGELKDIDRIVDRIVDMIVRYHGGGR